MNKVPELPKLSAEKELLRDRWSRIVDMVRKGRLEALSTFVSKHSQNDQPDWCGRLPLFLDSSMLRQNSTLLHLASSSDQPDIVKWLLYDRRVDPTDMGSQLMDGIVPNKTAYEVAASRATRNVFRRCMADHPDWCNWIGAARVPSALSEEQEQEQKSKGAKKRNMLKSKMREREKERTEADKLAEDAASITKEEEAARKPATLAIKPSSGPQKLGGLLVPPASSLVGLTDEQKMRIERERRARAAEARFRR
jgi:hypothetical protein